MSQNLISYLIACCRVSAWSTSEGTQSSPCILTHCEIFSNLAHLSSVTIPPSFQLIDNYDLIIVHVIKKVIAHMHVDCYHYISFLKTRVCEQHNDRTACFLLFSVFYEVSNEIFCSFQRCAKESDNVESILSCMALLACIQSCAKFILQRSFTQYRNDVITHHVLQLF